MKTKDPIVKFSARDRIKLAARRLFAERGVDGVTTREIVKAAGQKNQGSLNYYFGTKEDLVREIVVDGAKLIDERRNDMLDALTANGGPGSVEDITDILIFPAIRISRGGKYHEDSYCRFVTMLGHSHPDLFADALADRWNSGYQRCLSELRKMLPDIPPTVLNQRFTFIGTYLGSVLSMRERVLTDDARPTKLWASEGTLRHFSQTMASILTAPYQPGMFDEDELTSGDGDRSTTLTAGPLGEVSPRASEPAE